MKKKIFDLLMEIKSGVIRSIYPPSESKNPGERVADDLIDKSLPIPLRVEDVPAKNDLFEASLLTYRSKITTPETKYFRIEDGELSRNIAYTVSGELEAENTLLCLPGLLETKSSFSSIHDYFLEIENCKVISIDFSGRGDSDYIDTNGAYKMSLYLADVSQLIRDVVLKQGTAKPRLTILGTSMGGVLAMYLTQIFNRKITEIILNDIALTVNWTSLYALYKSMKNDVGFREARELAKELSVDEKAVADVQLPGHFDLSYRADVWGMNFHEALEGYAGKIGLIYGGKSKICTKQRVSEAKTFIPRIQTLEVANAGHPVPFNLAVCEFIKSEMDV